jgi:MraZ protein
MFRGHFEHAVDDKGRVAIPARFRDALSGLQDERLVVTKFKIRRRPCLDVYPFSAWRLLEGKILSKNRFDPEVRQLKSAYVSVAHECPVDSQGRILIPPLLRAHAGLRREVMFTGEIDMFRIWDKKVWQVTAGEDEGIFDEPDLLKQLGI